jgi:hypothetical protein
MLVENAGKAPDLPGAGASRRSFGNRCRDGEPDRSREAIRPYGEKWRPLAMLFAYFDESGLNPSERICSVAGLVGTEESWRSLAARWKPQLEELGIEHFHMTDCESGHGEFAGKDDAIRKYAVKQLAGIIAGHEVQPVFCAVPWEDWLAIDGPRVDDFKRSYPKPFHVAFEHCVQKLVEWSHVHADDEPIAMMFSEQNEFEATAREIFAAYKGSGFWGERLASIGFGQMRRFMPLQAADMVAGDINKYWDHVEYGTVEEWNNRELVKRLTSKRILQMGGMHTAQSLKYAVEKFAKVGRI